MKNFTLSYNEVLELLSDFILSSTEFSISFLDDRRFNYNKIDQTYIINNYKKIDNFSFCLPLTYKIQEMELFLKLNNISYAIY